VNKRIADLEYGVDRLSVDCAKIQLNSDFDSGIITILRGEVSQLIAHEVALMYCSGRHLHSSWCSIRIIDVNISTHELTYALVMTQGRTRDE